MDIVEDNISEKVIIIVPGIGGKIQSTEDARDFFVKNDFSVVRFPIKYDSLHKVSEKIDEVITYCEKYKQVYIIAKSLGGPAVFLSKGAEKIVMWDPSLDLKWLASKIEKKTEGYFLRNHPISNELYQEFLTLDIVSKIKDEKIILAGSGPYAHFKDKINAQTIKGANHKFSDHKEELFSMTLKILKN
ncbi:hypothetical protein HN587_01720 [Candidatus Woesearchaeota archaeon]|jgi:hypothetical protein|nr:hypothetical protein [Candidatus Woesearchaeota archaeon]